MTTKLLAFAGSTRNGSYNQALLELAITSARARGAEVTAVKLKDFELPLFDEDLEAAGVPHGAVELKSLFKSHHGFLIASPEYNHSISAVLKNAIDWVSRPGEGETLRTLSAFRGKVAGLMGASLSPFGSARGVMHLRLILSALQSYVVPEQVLVPSTHAAFNSDGTFKDELQRQLMTDLTTSVISLCECLRSAS
jgi:NAD(P)H-dependent FMN reductase